MDPKAKVIKKKLIAKRKDVKNKLDLLKHGEFVREKMFLPITKHLKNIEDKLVRKNPTEKEEAEDEQEVSFNESLSSSLPIYDEFKDIQYPESTKRVKNKSENTDNITSLPTIYESASDEEKENKSHSSRPKSSRTNKTVSAATQQQQQKTYRQKLTDESFQDYLDQYDPLPRFYIKTMLSDDMNQFDHKYGVRHNPTTEKFYIGDSQLQIEGPNIVVKNKLYKGTRGLYELLFKKNPKYFTQQDEDAYKDIVLKTNAHKRYYKSNKQVDGCRLEKYKKIISQFTSRHGDGMFMEVTENPIDYIHWDDPNELVVRLRLLLASTQAGHSGHSNEITSIIEELREANIIE